MKQYWIAAIVFAAVVFSACGSGPSEMKTEAKEVAAANAKGVTAADFEYEMSPSGRGILITKYKGLATVVVIPPVIEGFPVREMAWNNNGIAGNKELESITIPASFTGHLNFEGCTSLKSVIFPRNFSPPPNYNMDINFKGCTSLTSFDIPKGIKSFSFEGCSNLQSVTGVTGIYDDAFSGCTSLKSITLPAGITDIGFRAFKGSGLQSITLPDSLTTIWNGAFAGCTNLTSITIPRNVRMVGEFWTFNNSDSENLYFLYFNSFDGVFEGCKNLKSVTVQGPLRGLGPETFKGCTALEKVTFNGPITYLGKAAFEGCGALSELAFNGDVRYMGFSINQSDTGSNVLLDWLDEFENSRSQASRAPVFTGCTSLTTVTVGPAVKKIDDVDSIPTGKLTLASKAALAKVR